MIERKVNYECEIIRRNVTPAAFMAYVRRRLAANGGIDYAGDLDTRSFVTGSTGCNWDTTAEDGTHCISVEKPYHLQNYIKFPDGRVYNEVIEFDFEDEKTGYGYYYLIDAEITETPAETAQDAQETAETAETETTAAAEPETETAERAARVINPMCAECVKRGASCPGTTCQTYTGCVRRETIVSADSPTERSKTPAHITAASTAKLLDYWDYVRRLSYSAATALTRGWVLDELERRDPAGFARWLDSDDDSDYDATLRGFIRCDDAHVAWYAPQCDVAWCPGATREGARI